MEPRHPVHARVRFGTMSGVDQDPHASQSGERNWWFPAILIATTLVCLPSLAIGFLMDDYILLSHIDGTRVDAAPWWNVYDFVGSRSEVSTAGTPTGQLKPWWPWWAAPDLKFTFFRPLAGAWLAVERTIFGETAWPYHLTMVAVYIALVSAVGLLYRRVLSPAVAALALLIFALNDAHVFPVGWISNRHVLLSTLAGTFALLAHVRWREDQWAAGKLAAPLLLAMGLLAGETAVAFVGYLGAYELVAARGRGLERLRAFVPTFAVMLLYTSTYVAGDFGATGSGLYQDPIAEPVAFLSNAPRRMGALLSGGILGVPVVLWAMFPGVRLWMALGGASAALIIAGLMALSWRYFDSRSCKALPWLSLGAVAALVPVAATFPLDRLLLGANIGIAPTLAVLIHVGWSALRRRLSATRRERATLIVGGGLLALPNIVFSPFLMVVLFLGYIKHGHDTRAVAMEADLEGTVGKNVVVVAAPDFDTTLYFPWVRLGEGLSPAQTYTVLALVQQDAKLTRPRPSTLVLTLEEGAWMRTWYEHLFRSPHLPIPDRLSDYYDLFDVEVLARDGEDPTAVAFHFYDQIETDQFVFVRWHDGKLRRMALPPVGGQVALPFSPATGLVIAKD